MSDREEWEASGKTIMHVLGASVNEALKLLMGPELAKKTKFAVAVKGLNDSVLLTCTPDWAETFVTDMLEVEHKLGNLPTANGKVHIAGDPLGQKEA